MSDFIPALVLLVLLAAAVRDDTVLTLGYLMAAVFFVGRWWSRRAFKAVSYKRSFTDRAFPNERVPVQLEIRNTGRLPVVWLSVFDSAMPEISSNRNFRQVFSLGPRERKHFRYELQTYKRGYYPVGPLFLQSGDLFGLSDDAFSQGPADHLTVYPRILHLSDLGLPSHSPLGTLPHTLPIFEDPTRVIGKREYTAGDSLRRIDWKSTAGAGRLQVRQFEPSIALEISILLDFGEGSYDRRDRFDATELAIVVAASVASFVVNRKQSVGLITNARDAAGLGDGAGPRDTAWPAAATVVPVRKGRAHLMRLLEVLARAQLNDRAPGLPDLIRNQTVHLAWGTTLIVITGRPDDSNALLESLFRARRAGLNVVLIFLNQFAALVEVRRRAERFGFVVHQVTRERDLDMWRG